MHPSLPGVRPLFRLSHSTILLSCCDPRNGLDGLPALSKKGGKITFWLVFKKDCANSRTDLMLALCTNVALMLCLFVHGTQQV